MDNSLSFLTGSFISLAFSFLPGLKTWYNKYDSKKKQVIFAIVLGVITLLIAGLSCANVQIVGLPAYECNAVGIGDLVTAFFVALAGGVTTHQSTNYLK